MVNSRDIEFNAMELRKKFKIENELYVSIEEILESIDDITIVNIKMSDRISGLCIRTGNNKIIAVNSSLSLGRQRFTIAHELCHLYYHDEGCYVCSKDFSDDKSLKNIEYEADMFASYFLAPYYLLTEKFRELKNDKNDLMTICVKLEQCFGMSHLSLIRRLHDNKLITIGEYNNLAVRKPISFSQKAGLSTKLYEPTNINKTVGKYVRLSNELLDNGLISNSKYEELLLDAFREDLVYGSELVDVID